MSSTVNLIIEVTRRCNMKCAHCVRGRAQSVDISDQVIEALADRIVENGGAVRQLTFTGGEPLLAIDRIRRVMEVFKARGVRYHTFWMATNGALLDKDRIDLIQELISGADVPEASWIKVSIDDYHSDLGPQERKRLAAIPGVRLEVALSGYPVVAEGLAGENELPSAIAGVELIGEALYVSAKGSVLFACDISYSTIDSCGIASVFDEDSFKLAWETAARSYDLRRMYNDFVDWDDHETLREALDCETEEELKAYLRARESLCDQIDEFVRAGVNVDENELRWYVENCEGAMI